MADGDYSSIPVAGQKNPAKSRWIFEIFRDMSKFYLFMSQFLSEPKIGFCGYLVGGTVGYRVKCGVIFMCL